MIMPRGVYFRTKETRKIISKALRGKPSNMLGKHHSEETKEKIRLAQKGRDLSYLRTPEMIKKSLQRRKMSSLEIKFQKIINKYNLPYKFVGNGQFFIERKNPDFININGDKIAIEIYWKSQKENMRGISIEVWKKERLDIFSKYGWDILFIENSELNEFNILRLLKGGH